MLTIFAIPKPFRGHVGVIQRNAISQWTRLRPKPEILLFGDEEGTGQIAGELGVTHIPTVQRNEYGTPLLSDLFHKAQSLARYKTLCYINSDIMLLGEFMAAVQRVVSWRERFLMVGIRRNVDLDQPPIYQLAENETRLRRLVLEQNMPISPWSIDYFVFPRWLLPSFPEFAVGRPAWDNWFLWKARDSKAALIDASTLVFAIHQNHDYAHHPQGQQGVLQGAEQQHNRRLAAGRLKTINDATYRITAAGIKYNPWGLLAPTGRKCQRVYWALLRVTAPVRHPLGIRQAKITNVLGKAQFWSR